MLVIMQHCLAACGSHVKKPFVVCPSQQVKQSTAAALSDDTAWINMVGRSIKRLQA